MLEGGYRRKEMIGTEFRRQKRGESKKSLLSSFGFGPNMPLLFAFDSLYEQLLHSLSNMKLIAIRQVV